MDRADELVSIKKKVDRLKEQQRRMEGALDNQMSALKREHDCDSLEEARSLLKKLQAELSRAEAKFDKALEDFEEEYGEQLDSVQEGE